MKQNYRNHIKFYPLHHFIFLPLMLVCMITGICMALKHSGEALEWSLFAILSFCILLLAIMLRQHYALGNQDRIVRLEFRLRYFELFGTNASTVETRLTFGQIAALRFADDTEFKDLLVRATEEHLSSKTIKQAIRNWQADYMRV